MHNAVHKMFLAAAMGLTAIFVNDSGATAASLTCKTQIADTDGAIASAMKLASAITYGVTGLVTGGSGDHPGHLFITELEQFQKATYEFIVANKSYVYPDPSKPDPSKFDPTSDCPQKPQGSEAEDGCDYCPMFDPSIRNGQCPKTYYQGLNGDAYTLAFGPPAPSTPLLALGLGKQIDPTESIECIARYFRRNQPFSPREIAASDLALATHSILGSTDGSPSNPAFLQSLGIF